MVGREALTDTFVLAVLHMSDADIEPARFAACPCRPALDCALQSHIGGRRALIPRPRGVGVEWVTEAEGRFSRSVRRRTPEEP